LSILDKAKGIAEAVHQINNPELYERVLELNSDLVGIIEENTALRSENADQKKKLEIKGNHASH
jgi:regulator of replication initiation timing